jgi:hypothetical protein
MKTAIASALAALVCVTAVSACSGGGKQAHPSPAGVGVSTAPAAAGQAAPGAPSGAPDAGTLAGSSASADPDPELSSINQQLSGVDGALSSAEQTPSDGG